MTVRAHLVCIALYRYVCMALLRARVRVVAGATQRLDITDALCTMRRALQRWH